MTDRPDFAQLVASRRAWIQDTLQPWCRQALRADLLKAESEWADIAGKAAPEHTLWTWAWSRFPELVYDGLTGVNETQPVRIVLRDGSERSGFPDGRRSVKGELFLFPDADVQNSSTENVDVLGPFSLDEITQVSRSSVD